MSRFNGRAITSRLDVLTGGNGAMLRLPSYRYFFPAIARRSHTPALAGCKSPARHGKLFRHQSTAAAAVETAEVVVPSIPFPGRHPRHPSNPPRLREHDAIALINGALKIYHNARNHAVSEDDFATAWSIAGLRSRRPKPHLVTAQMILYTTDGLDPDLEAQLPAAHEWDQLLEKPKKQGFEHEQLFDWVNILVADTVDKKVQAFLETPGRKPTFLLNYLLNDRASSNGRLMSAESLYGLIEHCKSWYDADTMAKAEGEREEEDAQVNTWSPEAFNGIISRLLSLARRIQPMAVVGVADLAASHLSRPKTSTPAGARFRLDCRMYNFILQRLSTASPESPYATRHFSWQGILKLLSLSSALEKPLIIERDSYQAIREVLLGLRKDDSERETASALRSTWPPYRMLRNGLEDATPLEDFYSRAVKAGVMMQEAGYEKQLVDLATDVLGGLAPDGSPTLHTRAAFPPQYVAPDSIWAAQVRATRSPEEAWQAFQHPPENGMHPSLAVYTELINKIVTAQVDPHHDYFPGDGRETTPFNEYSLSDFEKARLKPPSLSFLVSRMIGSGIRLEGRTLCSLIRYAPTADEAIHYVQHSALSEAQRRTLKQVIRGDEVPIGHIQPTGLGGISSNQIKDLPPPVVHAVVDLLCRFQPNRTANMPARIESSRLHRIASAYRLALLCESYRSRAILQSVLKALARANIIIQNDSRQGNAMRALLMSGQALSQARARSGVTKHMFHSLARTVQNVVYMKLPDLIEELESDYCPDTSAASSTRDSDSLLQLFLGSSSSSPRGHDSGPSSSSPEPRGHRPVPPPQWPKYHPSRKAGQVLQVALGELASLWAELSVVRCRPRNGRGCSGPRASGPGPDSNHDHHPAAVTATPIMVFDYMRTLAFLGTFDEMAALLAFTTRHAAAIASNSEAKDAVHVVHALYLFRGYAEPMLDGDVVARLREGVQRLGRGRDLLTSAGVGRVPVSQKQQVSSMYWPSDEEVREYLASDAWGHRQNLDTVLRLVRERRDGGSGGDDGATRLVNVDDAWWEWGEMSGAAAAEQQTRGGSRALSALADASAWRLGMA